MGMDGPAFHSARDGINELKRTESLFRWKPAEELGCEYAWVNPTLDLISHHSSTWKPKRMFVLESLLAGEKSVVEISRESQMTLSATYKNMRAGGLSSIVELTTEITTAINSKLRQ
jgi:hypothetical protein